jgi:hypothetical protein
MGFFLCFSDLLSNLGVLISDITPIWTVIVAKNHSDMSPMGVHIGTHIGIWRECQ